LIQKVNGTYTDFGRLSPKAFININTFRTVAGILQVTQAKEINLFENHYVETKKNIRLKQYNAEEMHETLNEMAKVKRGNPY